MLQQLAHGPEPVRAAIEGVAALQRARPNAGFGQVVRMDELVGVSAIIEYRDIFALVNPFEKNLKYSEPAVPTIV